MSMSRVRTGRDGPVKLGIRTETSACCSCLASEKQGLHPTPDGMPAYPSGHRDTSLLDAPGSLRFGCSAPDSGELVGPLLCCLRCSTERLPDRKWPLSCSPERIARSACRCLRSLHACLRCAAVARPGSRKPCATRNCCVTAAERNNTGSCISSARVPPLTACVALRLQGTPEHTP